MFSVTTSFTPVSQRASPETPAVIQSTSSSFSRGFRHTGWLQLCTKMSPHRNQQSRQDPPWNFETAWIQTPSALWTGMAVSLAGTMLKFWTTWSKPLWLHTRLQPRSPHNRDEADFIAASKCSVTSEFHRNTARWFKDMDCRYCLLKFKVTDISLARPISSVIPGVSMAPEVMLHISFNEPIDTWSLGHGSCAAGSISSTLEIWNIVSSSSSWLTVVLILNTVSLQEN